VSTVVAKIGSSSITDDRGVIDHAMIASLCEQTVRLRRAGHRVLIVSSGAVSAGVSALGFSERPTDMPTLQAISAVGQARLIQVYDTELSAAGYVPAQVLLTSNEFTIRRQYLHARQTLLRLLDLGVVPIINENDAIANDELRYGDNDRLAALVSHLVNADLLVLLTDTAGLFTADPRTDPAATLVTDVLADDPMLHVEATATGSNRGSGGMASKLASARIASWSGVTAVIAKAQRPDVLIDAVAGQAVGTRFEAHDRRLSARKLWIGFASGSSGTIVVDDGARRAVVERGTSLLPAGIVDVRGAFDEGDTVEVAGPNGAVFARGLVTMSANDLRSAIGKRSGEAAAHLPREAVHRDDLVLIGS
jgi:glutamate 5-kinase